MMMVMMNTYRHKVMRLIEVSAQQPVLKCTGCGRANNAKRGSDDNLHHFLHELQDHVGSDILIFIINSPEKTM